MELFKEFISTCGTTIIKLFLTAFVGYIGVVVKNIYQKYVNDKVKQDVVKTCVKAVEQIYKNLHGEEKLQKALDSVGAMLQSKNIDITEIELKMLIESALAEFNDAFNKTSTTE